MNKTANLIDKKQNKVVIANPDINIIPTDIFNQAVDEFNTKMINVNTLIQKEGLTDSIQSLVNNIISSATNKCLDIENQVINTEEKDGLKKLFREKTKNWLFKSYCIKRSYEKPRGYAGDYKVIDAIYQNRPQGENIELAVDTYFLDNPGSSAMRSRKKYILEIINNYINNNNKHPVSIINVGCGPGTDILELLSQSDKSQFKSIDMVDQDEEALTYSKNQLSNYLDIVNFHKENMLKFIVNNRKTLINQNKYNIVLCVGLFDYFDQKSSASLLNALYNLCDTNGIVVFSNWNTSNPSKHELEWVCDWYVYHRNRKQMEEIYKLSAINASNIIYSTDPSGHFQICEIIK